MIKFVMLTCSPTLLYLSLVQRTDPAVADLYLAIIVEDAQQYTQ